MCAACARCEWVCHGSSKTPRPRSGAAVTPGKGDLPYFDRDLPKQVVLRHLVVVIPAHNHAHRIAHMRTLNAQPSARYRRVHFELKLRELVAELKVEPLVPLRVEVLLDNCRPRTLPTEPLPMNVRMRSPNELHALCAARLARLCGVACTASSAAPAVCRTPLPQALSKAMLCSPLLFPLCTPFDLRY
jgi:hypothetical protein